MNKCSCVQYATSIMVCGGYEDDADDGHELTYTGAAPCLSAAPSAFYALPFDTPQSCLSLWCRVEGMRMMLMILLIVAF